MPAALRVAIPLSAGNLGFGAYLRFALSREFYLREKDFSEMRSPHVTSKCNERRNYHRNRPGLGERKTQMQIGLSGALSADKVSACTLFHFNVNRSFSMTKCVTMHYN